LLAGIAEAPPQLERLSRGTLRTDGRRITDC
jgi:hypothetical protein